MHQLTGAHANLVHGEDSLCSSLSYRLGTSLHSRTSKSWETPHNKKRPPTKINQYPHVSDSPFMMAQDCVALPAASPPVRLLLPSCRGGWPPRPVVCLLWCCPRRLAPEPAGSVAHLSLATQTSCFLSGVASATSLPHTAVTSLAKHCLAACSRTPSPRMPQAQGPTP